MYLQTAELYRLLALPISHSDYGTVLRCAAFYRCVELTLITNQIKGEIIALKRFTAVVQKLAQLK